MSMQLLTQALYGDHGALDATSRLILIVLADNAGTEGVAWPSRYTIARATGLSMDTVDRRLAVLLRAGKIAPADPNAVPHAWRTWRGDRRPKAYKVLPRPAKSYPQDKATGPQSPAAPSEATGPQTDATGPQNRAYGAATVRPNQELKPKYEQSRAGAREAPAVDNEQATPNPNNPMPIPDLCPDCHQLHPGDETCTEASERRASAKSAAGTGVEQVRRSVAR